MGVKLNTASGGSVSIEPTNTASNFTLTVPAQTGTVVASDSSGNVGIGTTSPATKLEVSNGAITAGASGDVLIGRFSSSFPSPGAGYFRIRTNNEDGNNGGISIDTLSSGTLVERMRINQTGLFQFNSGYGSVATAYGCRAWVNFNGTGTVAIRGSGNVSSITDNGTGDYTVNFSTAMPDENYAALVSGNENNNQLNRVFNLPSTSTSPTTSAIRMSMVGGGSGSRIDAQFVYVAVFR